MNREFTYKEIDEEGEETLEAIAIADRFNEWMYDTIKPYCRGKILEIGSGIGNISQFFLRDRANLVLSDIRTTYCDTLAQKFSPTHPNIEITQIDLVKMNFLEEYAPFIGQFDTVFALNVVEHIEHDSLALYHIHQLLKPGGTVIILVPAYQTLYNHFDEALGHYRRYTKRTLSQLVNENFELIHQQYFNLAGIMGWFMTGTLMKKKTIPKDQMKLYNKLVPIFKVIDRISGQRIGLSVIQVGRKKLS